MNLEKKQIVIDKLEWFYREGNPVNKTEKLPILFLHGFPSQSYSWTMIMPDLAEKGYHTIAPDWIGLGFSSKPEKSEFSYTPTAFINALKGFIAALELEKFYLVVQGFLGSVGIQYALKNSDQIAGLILLNTPLFPETKLPWKIQQLGLPFVGDMMTQDPLMIDRTLEGGCRYTISDKDLDMYRRPLLQSSASGRSLLAIVRNFQLKESLEEIRQGFSNWSKPTLIIWGVRDPWLNVSQAEKLATSLNHGKLITLPEAAHYPQEHWSGEISQAILSFVTHH